MDGRIDKIIHVINKQQVFCFHWECNCITVQKDRQTDRQTNGLLMVRLGPACRQKWLSLVLQTHKYSLYSTGGRHLIDENSLSRVFWVFTYVHVSKCDKNCQLKNN